MRLILKLGLNIKWIEEALENEIDITCTRNDNCPRKKKCENTCPNMQ